MKTKSKWSPSDYLYNHEDIIEMTFREVHRRRSHFSRTPFFLDRTQFLPWAVYLHKPLGLFTSGSPLLFRRFFVQFKLQVLFKNN